MINRPHRPYSRMQCKCSVKLSPRTCRASYALHTLQLITPRNDVTKLYIFAKHSSRNFGRSIKPVVPFFIRVFYTFCRLTRATTWTTAHRIKNMGNSGEWKKLFTKTNLTQFTFFFFLHCLVWSGRVEVHATRSDRCADHRNDRRNRTKQHRY